VFWVVLHWFFLCFSGFSPLFSPLIFLFLFWVYFSFLSPKIPPFIEKLAPQPVLPLQDCYGIHERDRGQEIWSMIGFVAADFPVEPASSAQT
jgi:hypothetical protein